MATKHDLKSWVLEAIEDQGGSATIPQVAEHIWRNHESDLRRSGDLFYTWQYDMRWAAQSLRDERSLAPMQGRRGGRWALHQ